MKATSLTNKYIEIISEVFSSLQKTVTAEDVERIAVLLVRAMGGESRDYHAPEHSIDVSKTKSPIARIAALFHDIIYVQVDSSWRQGLIDCLGPMVPDDGLKLDVKHGLTQSSDPWLWAIAVLFGMEENDSVIPGKGINEFLSALVAHHFLSPFLSTNEMLRVLACIESTIPFRRTDTRGNSPEKLLISRLQKACHSLAILGFTANEIEVAIDDCRAMVSTDLSSFAASDPGIFLSDTWSVMFENNSTLRNNYFFINEYRKAIFGVLDFIGSLDTSYMFWGKSNHALQTLESQSFYASRNIELSSIYLKAFATGLCLLEAIAIETGGDLPFETMVGALKRSREHLPKTIDKYLKITSDPKLVGHYKTAFNYLLSGRTKRARFDRKEFVLGALILSTVEAKGLDKLFNFCRAFSSGSMGALELLNKFPQNTLRQTLSAVRHTAYHRSNRLSALEKILFRESKKAA